MGGGSPAAVAAARRAGADQADAIAVRSISLAIEVRDGAVEESQRSEGDDVGLRVLVGRKQAVVSTNDLNADGLDALAERAYAPWVDMEAAMRAAGVPLPRAALAASVEGEPARIA